MITAFLYKSFRYFVVVLILQCISFLCLKSLYFSLRTPILKKEIFQKNKTKTRGVVLGSSHTLYGINTGLTDSVFINMASTSQGLFEDFEIIKFTFKSQGVSKYILPISLFSNHHYLASTSILGERVRLFDYRFAYKLNYKTQNDFENYKHFVGSIFNTKFKKGETIFDRKGNLIGNCFPSGKFKNNVEEAFQRHLSGADFGEMNPYLDSIIDFTKRNNIDLAVIIMPFTRAYCEKIKSSQFDKWFKNLEKTHGDHILFLDYRNLFSNKNEDSLFNDADHLSICGRDLFSKELFSSLGSLGF